MDDHRWAAKGHAQPCAKEASASASTCHPTASAGAFDANRDAKGRKRGHTCISEPPGRQTGQLGPLVEEGVRADGDEGLDAARPTEDMRDARGRARCRSAYRQRSARPQEPRE